MSSDQALREGVRQNLSHWIMKLECGGDVEKQQEFKRKFLNKLKQSVVAIETDTANEQHYEVPTEFFKTVLGKRLKYSCCQFPTEETTLDQAEELSLQQVCQLAMVKDGQAVMDLGCGWGSLGFFICERYPNCVVTCVSNSATQRQHIEGEADKRGYHKRLECITADANHFNTEKRYDRVISLEMFEHMRNYETLMARVSRWLKPSGMLFTQILCHREFPYAFDTKRGADTEWMARNFFSGGTMPSADLFLYFQKDLVLLDHWKVNGVHYSKTLEAWLQIMDQNIEKVKDSFARAYGKDAVDQQIFNWRLFFMFCSEVFGYKEGNEWMVSYHLFKKRPMSSL
ncbi:uncharacterized protein LOC135493184 [Lineus longissimus]|uniref:uncharacterized protein LOC135493184 n=1 Tax=Lineus longissimus TaxID=88925 RepID=UPI002B4C83F2